MKILPKKNIGKDNSTKFVYDFLGKETSVLLQGDLDTKPKNKILKFISKIIPDFLKQNKAKQLKKKFQS